MGGWGGVIDYTVSCMCCTFFVMLDGTLCVCLLGDDMHVTCGGPGWGGVIHYTVLCMCCTFFVMLDGMLCVCLLGDDMHVTCGRGGGGPGWGSGVG